MVVLDLFIYGFYILLKPFYQSNDNGFGAIEHSLMLMWALLTLSFHLIFIIIAANSTIHFLRSNIFISILGLIFLIFGYVIYIKKDRKKVILEKDVGTFIKVVISLMTVSIFVLVSYLYITFPTAEYLGSI